MVMIYLLWLWEDRSATWGMWNIIGCFPSMEAAKAIANRQNYPAIATGHVWGGALEWKPANMGFDSISDDEGIGAWYIQEVLLGSLVSEPMPYPQREE